MYEVEKFSRELGVVVLTKVNDIKGENKERFKQSLFKKESVDLPRHILNWAEAGSRAVIFRNKNALVVCLGHQWYDATLPDSNDVSYRGIDRSEMPLAYSGPVMRLAEALKVMQSGGQAVITAVPHNTNDVLATVDTAMNRTSLPGYRPLIRVKASLKMPMMVMSVSDAPQLYILGTGSAGVEDLPELKKRLEGADAMDQAEAADELRSLKGQAAPVQGILEKMLKDENPRLSASAAGALIAIDENNLGAKQTFTGLMKSKNTANRRAAARTLSMMGETAKGFAILLGDALSDEDEVVRAVSLQALCTLGKDGASEWEKAAKLLDDPALAADAADALGRMGAVARPCQSKLAELLKSKDETTQWAAVRGMVQIGGPDVQPAIDFMIKKLENANEKEAYNIMMYFVVLGPDGKHALPDLKRLREKDVFRYILAVWSMDPENSFPWDTEGMPKVVTTFLLNQDIIRQNFESIIREMGDRAKPAARSLAKKAIEGTSGFMGNVPGWGYQLLVDFPEEALPILEKGLHVKDPVQQQGALMAVGHMGSSAGRLRDQVQILTTSNNETTRQLADWCVKQLGPATN